MNRRNFVKLAGGSAACCLLHPVAVRRASGASPAQMTDRDGFAKLADVALATAKKLGASYADMRLLQNERESIQTREERVEGVDSSRDSGFGVRVLVDGAWGFASSNRIEPDEVETMTRRAIEIAKANGVIQSRKVELEIVPAYNDTWTMPMAKDPFEVPIARKIEKLLGINRIAKDAGASFCSSGMSFERETKFFASSYGSLISQIRVRSAPGFNVTVVDKDTGKFASRGSFAAPRGSGYEYVDGYDFAAEAALAAREASEKLKAKPAEPGVKDLVLHPNHLWLTIHESIGHSTELDRALGWEANFAGTSFVTPDKLGKLQFGSPLITALADRSQPGGLSTIAYDDDGVKTAGSEFPIIKDGIFRNYQMAIGQAALIGLSKSNGCAYADGYGQFPIQRMPNVSLQPGEKDISIEELAADVKDGICIMGNGSWSIDQQRYNFQFGGQTFREIKNGKIGAMLRDVAYQGNTVEFWNSCDGIGGKSHYFLGGALNCGKGQPGQSAPVSHGAVPARFRKVRILNTARTDIA